MKTVYMLTICCLLALICGNVNATIIEYDVSNISGNRFEYNYAINNDALSIPIEEFTIWFDVDLYENLVITTPEPLRSQWDEIILDDTGFGLPLGYDSLFLNGGILPMETVSGFSVEFDWLGTQIPGSQFFEIVNPITFETIDSGYTVPEPATFLLFGLGSLALLRKRGA